MLSMRSHVGEYSHRTKPATYREDTAKTAKAESTFCACPGPRPPWGRAEWRHLAAPARDVTVRRWQEEGLGGARGGRRGGRAHGEFRGAGAVRAGAGGAGRQSVSGHLHCEQVRGLGLQRGAQAAGARRGLENQSLAPPGRSPPWGDPRRAQPPPSPSRSGRVPAPSLKIRPRRAPRRRPRASRSRPRRCRELRDASGRFGRVTWGDAGQAPASARCLGRRPPQLWGAGRKAAPALRDRVGPESRAHSVSGRGACHPPARLASPRSRSYPLPPVRLHTVLL